MLATSLPKGVRGVADNLKDCFEHKSYQNICAIIAYFLLNKNSVSELTRTASFAKSVSSNCRTIHSFKHNRAMRRLWAAGLRSLRSSNPDDLVFAVDDTANPKFGRKIFASDFWGSSSGVYFGQKVLGVAIVDLKRKIAGLSHQIMPLVSELTER